MKRGDVVIAATGSGFGRKPRPWVVIQSDDYPTQLVILLGVTTALDLGFVVRPRVEPSDKNGLQKTSDIMVDVPVVAAKSDVIEVIGKLAGHDLLEVEAALLVILGFSAET